MTTLVPWALSLLLQSTALLLLGLLALRLTRSCGPAVQTLIGRAALAGVALLLLLAPLTGHVHPLWCVTLEPTAARPSAAKPTPPRSSPTLPRGEGEEVGAQLATPSSPQYGLRGGTDTSTSPSFRGEKEGAARSEGAASNQGAARSEGAASSAPTPVMPPLRPPLWGGPLRSKEVGSVLWATVTLTLLLWLAVCQGHLTRLRRTATPLPSGPAAKFLAELTPRPPLLLTHPSVRSPFLAGLVRPAIFLPPTYATDFTPDALRAILAHELAHLQRRDNLWILAARLLCALLWPQPLLWLICRRLVHIAEDACDAAVLAQNCPPHAYADCLLTLAEHYSLPRRQRALGAGVTPYRSTLGRRVQRILTQGKQTMLPISTKLRLTIAALTLAAALGGVFLVSSAPAQVSTPIPAHTDYPAIVGSWLYENQPITSRKEGLVTYQPDGKFAYLFLGTARQEPEQSFGAYVLNGSKLKEFTTSTSFDDPNQRGKSNILPTDVNFTTLQFQVSGDTLTVRDGTGEVSIAKRLSANDAEATRQRLLGTTQAVSQVQEAGPSTARVTPMKSDDATDDLTQARFLAGLTAVQGPGVVVTLRDSKVPYPSTMPPGMSLPNLIHDTDINQVVNELRAAGAEAISVNDQRLVATSAVRCVGPLIYVNNLSQPQPYTIKAIGNSEALIAAINIPHGIASQIRSFDKAMFEVHESKMLDLPAFKGDNSPRYAKPFEADAPILTPQEQQYLVAKTQDLQNLRQLGLAVTQYASDNEGRYPDADHWMDQVYPYFKNKTVFYDPFQSGQHYGYAFNRNCSKKSMRAFASPSDTVIVYASTLGTRNASDTGASLRINQPPSSRFHAGSGYVFVDIHTKWFQESIHPSFSLEGEPSILGTWVGPNSNGIKAALIFSPGNIVEEVGPWSGDSRKIAHFYGRYNERPTMLKYVLTRVWVEGTPIYTVSPEKHIINYTQSGDVLTLGSNGKPGSIYHRTHTYIVHKPKGFLWI